MKDRNELSTAQVVGFVLVVVFSLVVLTVVAHSMLKGQGSRYKDPNRRGCEAYCETHRSDQHPTTAGCVADCIVKLEQKGDSDQPDPSEE